MLFPTEIAEDVLQCLENCLNAMRQRNNDEYFNFEICWAEAHVNKAKGLPYDTYYTGEGA